MAKLRLGDFQHDGTQYVLRFQEKGGKSREIPVRHDLEGFILAYVDSAGLAGETKETPLFRASNGRSRKLAAKPLGTERICELVKRRLKDAGLLAVSEWEVAVGREAADQGPSRLTTLSGRFLWAIVSFAEGIPCHGRRH